MDTFDIIRCTLWANRAEKRSILTGITWHNSWTYASGGIIPRFYVDRGNFGHAFKVFGWKEIADEPYLVAQLSNGENIGDKGIFYFPRNVVNKEFTYGAYTFSDMPPEQAKQLGWSIYTKIYNFSLKYWNEILK